MKWRKIGRSGQECASNVTPLREELAPQIKQTQIKVTPVRPIPVCVGITFGGKETSPDTKSFVMGHNNHRAAGNQSPPMNAHVEGRFVGKETSPDIPASVTLSHDYH